MTPSTIKPLRSLFIRGVLDQFNQASLLAQATNEARLRESRTRHPDGKFDKAGRWYPSDIETQTCCAGIRSPSRSWQYALMLHCRCVCHIAKLFNVAPLDLKREKKRQILVEQKVQLQIAAQLNPIATVLTAMIRDEFNQKVLIPKEHQ